MQTITVLDVQNSNISDLTGIEDFQNLIDLYCQDNQIVSLDLSQNSKLEDFGVIITNLLI